MCQSQLPGRIVMTIPLQWISKNPAWDNYKIVLHVNTNKKDDYFLLPDGHPGIRGLPVRPEILRQGLDDGRSERVKSY